MLLTKKAFTIGVTFFKKIILNSQFNWILKQALPWVGFAVLVSFFIFAFQRPWQRIEYMGYELGLRLNPAYAPNNSIAVIAIDEKSLENIGPWPWDRHIMTRMIRRLQDAKAGVIGINIDFSAPQNQRAFELLQQIEALKVEEALSRRYAGLGAQYRRLLNSVTVELASDWMLARQVRRAGNVVLGLDGYSTLKKEKSSVPGFLSKQSLDIPGDESLMMEHFPKWMQLPDITGFSTVSLPNEEMGSSAARLGVVTPEPMQAFQGIPLLLHYQNLYLPSYALQLTALYYQTPLAKVKIFPKGGLKVAQYIIHTDSGYRIYPRYYGQRDGIPPFKLISFDDAYQGKVSLREFRDKIVLIGPTHPSLCQPVLLPQGQKMPPVLVNAHLISNILNREAFAMVPAFEWWQRLGLTLVLLYLIFAVPRLSRQWARTVTILILIGLFITELIFLLRGVWLPLLAPALLLLLGYGILLAWRFFKRGFHLLRTQPEADEANRLLGVALHYQGHLDEAFDRLRRCRMSGAVADALYNLGLDFERRRQFNKAAAVFFYIMENGQKEYRDVAQRHQRMQVMEKAFVFGISQKTLHGTMILSPEAMEKPMIGRYEITGELGQGAMGMVYLGKDSKMDRTVAIKTMAISHELKPEAMAEVKERFFLEAMAAGRLNHPNIVTVFDMGEEDDLAYIVMDYVQGETLKSFIEAEKLLPVSEVLRIGIQVADALEYAHCNRIIHRDIKPANIMYDPKTGRVKVTDFGVASLTDSTRTRTGTIIGTPSYMSPEQVAGKHVEAGSDLFSLGVTLFQLLSGQLPFTGDSLASVIFKIANEPFPDIRALRKDLAPAIGALISKALQKAARDRYQTAAEMKTDLQKCLEQVEKVK
jgi:serine/threonine-protein kinase